MIASGTLVFLVVFVGCFFYNPLKKPIRTIAEYFPYPVAMVEGKIIASKEIIQSTTAVQNFYKSQDFSQVGMRIDFSTPQGEQRLKIKEKDVFDKKIENLIIAKLAKERGLVVSKSDAREILDKQIEESGNEQSFKVNLKTIYGWNVEEFRDNVVIPQLYMRKLADYYFEKESKETEGHQAIINAEKELKSDGSNFDEISKKYSQGKSAENGGELGWFRQDQLTPEVGEIVFKMSESQVSEIIRSSLGYHIVQVQQIREVENANSDEKQNEESNNNKELVKEVKIRQIFISEGGFIDWLSEQKKEASVYIFPKEYKWQADEGKIIFSDDAMNRMEESLRSKAEGDPSMD